MSSGRKQRKTVQSEAREVIASVVKLCDEEGRRKQLSFPLTRATDRAARYRGVSTTLIKTIRRQSKDNDEKGTVSPLHTPGKHRSRPAHRNVTNDAFDMSVIRRTVQEFYLAQNKIPSCSKLLPVIKHRTDFPWDVYSLRNILHTLGFRWKKCLSKPKILIERPDIVNWRGRYLVKIKALRSEGRQIFYVDESWVDSNLTFKMLWQSEEVKGVCAVGNAGKRLIMVHA
jgi:hypothetical protein